MLWITSSANRVLSSDQLKAVDVYLRHCRIDKILKLLKFSSTKRMYAENIFKVRRTSTDSVWKLRNSTWVNGASVRPLSFCRYKSLFIHICWMLILHVCTEKKIILFVSMSLSSIQHDDIMCFFKSHDTREMRISIKYFARTSKSQRKKNQNVMLLWFRDVWMKIDSIEPH